MNRQFRLQDSADRSRRLLVWSAELDVDRAALDLRLAGQNRDQV